MCGEKVVGESNKCKSAFTVCDFATFTCRTMEPTRTTRVVTCNHFKFGYVLHSLSLYFTFTQCFVDMRERGCAAR